MHGWLRESRQSEHNQAGDPATAARGGDIGCIHGVAWYARTLGTALLAAITAEPRSPLSHARGAAIVYVPSQHEGTCDLTNPASPAATVTAVSRSLDGLDYPALSDSTIAVESDAGRQPLIITDNRPFCESWFGFSCGAQ